jgi:hypothetical protein
MTKYSTKSISDTLKIFKKNKNKFSYQEFWELFFGKKQF